MIRLERIPFQPAYNKDGFVGEQQGHWRLWFTANQDFTEGNFLELFDDGSCKHVHIGQSYERVLVVKEEDV